MDMSYFKNRRTVRKYKNEAIPMDKVKSMLEDAMRAPSTGNMQLYSAIITTDNEIKQQLAPCHFNQPQLMQAPVVITFCADFNRFNKWCEYGNAVPGYDNFLSFMTATIDASIYAHQFNTIAELNGYGCCHLGTTNYNAPQIAKILHLPKFVVPIITLTLGIPDGESPQCERLPVEAVIHMETYHDYSTADIERLHKEKEELEINKKFVEENGKTHLAQVFTDIRYTKANNEYFSKVLHDFMVESGFKLPE